ncbi:MAG: PDZ domain-containing protein [Trueperaceae bacterium]|nr:PDZ domain-containing protein [Trueperaceae bacterium]
MLRKYLLIFLLFFGFAFAQQELWDTAMGRERIFNALVDTFKENYWDTNYRDWNAWADEFREDALNAESRAQFDRVLSRMILDLHDDHSRWIGRLGEGMDFGGTESGQEGLGFQHAFLGNTGIVVERVYPDTPASIAGLQRGDVIVSINNEGLESSSDFSYNRIIREAIDSGHVSLEVKRKQSRISLELTPTRIDFGSVSSLPQANMLDEHTGYIYLPSFEGEGIGQKVHDLIRELEAQGADSLILDLRDNPGGRLGELGLVMGAFLDGEWVEAISHGELVWRARYRRNGDQGINALIDPEDQVIASERIEDPVTFNGPLAVLVTKFNSSAGEIGPLVLQNLGRATIVGEVTSGNVEAIRTFDLPDGSLVYVAVANLQALDGTDFTTGLQPDVIVDDSSLDELARGFDAPVAEALKALKGLPFTPGKFF